MSAISLSKGWWIFAKALLQSKPWSVSHAAELMFHLNVTARNLRRHPITDQIYELKNVLIKYLYQHGYCVEVKLHTQKRMCYSCDGTGEYWTGEDCWKCYGTGVFSTTQLYAFRFNVSGRRYAWHQLKKLIDYPITLTEAEPGSFVEPTPKEDLALTLEDAWLACCIVWLFLTLHGFKADLLLFAATRNRLNSWLVKLKLPHAHIIRSNHFMRVAHEQGERVEPEWEYAAATVPDDDDIPF